MIMLRPLYSRPVKRLSLLPMFAFLFRSLPANLRRPRQSRPQPAAEPEDDAVAWLVYDGECPLCRNYARYLESRQSRGQLRLVNARDGGPRVQEVRDLPHNLDDGMVLKLNGRYYRGADALYRLAWQSDRRGLFGRLNGLLFRSATAARLGYPLLKLGRCCLLKLKGVPPLD